ncbi:MAG: peptidoglycan DD-metalloendopeptidase family protein [Chloroflexota bacterium]|nr:peptidoglycan DD-metalloendopeptidase family protein [Chloroflexota bacterium]
MTKEEKLIKDNPEEEPINLEDIEGQVLDSDSEIIEDEPKAGIFNNPRLIRGGIYILTFLVIVLIAWGAGSLIVNSTAASPLPTATTRISAAQVPSNLSTPSFSTVGMQDGVVRLPNMNTTHQPEVEQRNEVITYDVQQGDSIFSIADKFGLKPESVLWANRYILGDTPDGLGIGVTLNILPEDGVYYRWVEGDGLNGVAKGLNVDPDVIVNYPLNNLDPETVGDYRSPNIEPGTMLVVPGGTLSTVSWIIARDNPASGAKYLGPGACSGIIYGDVGTGTFVYPTTATWLSGYDWNPPVHNGLDFDGDFGSPIYAADTGVIVYSGWSDRGYGYLIVVDHDSGWQTFYAHLMEGTLLPCGASVQKGQLIASMGSTGNSTGPHLHFEMRLGGSPVNPWPNLN